MAKKVMTDKHKLMSYLLTEEFDRTQQKVAELFDVSQSTISSAVKEAKLLSQIKSMQNELNQARQALVDKGYKPNEPKLLDAEIIEDKDK